jgi:hypothetical protein
MRRRSPETGRGTERGLAKGLSVNGKVPEIEQKQRKRDQSESQTAE